MNRLQKICRWARYGVLLLLILMVVGILGYVGILVLLVADPEMTVMDMSHGYLVGLGISGLAGSLLLTVICYYLYRLVDSMGTNESPFVRQNVGYLKLMAVLIIVEWAVVVAIRVAVSYTLDSSPVPTDVSFLVVGFVVYIIALVFQYGVALQEESDSFV